MKFPISRPRRLRKSDAIRRLVRETRLSPSQFILPLFVSELVRKPEPIPSMPGVSNLPVAEAAKEAGRAFSLGIPAVLLFGTPSAKDATGSSSLAPDGIVQRAVREIKSAHPAMLVVTDICLCEYTDHGHCGILEGETVDNDATLEVLARQAVSHAEAGADIVAPSNFLMILRLYQRIK